MDNSDAITTGQRTSAFYVRFVKLCEVGVSPILKLIGFIETPNGLKRCTLLIHDLTRVLYIRTLEDLDPNALAEEVKLHSNFFEADATGSLVEMGNLYNSKKHFVFQIRYHAKDYFYYNNDDLPFSSYAHGATLTAMDIFCMDKQLMGPTWMELDLYANTGIKIKELISPSKNIRPSTNPNISLKSTPVMKICSLEVFYDGSGNNTSPAIIAVMSGEIDGDLHTISDQVDIFINYEWHLESEVFRANRRSLINAANSLFVNEEHVKLHFSSGSAFMICNLRERLIQLDPDILIGDHKLTKLHADVLNRNNINDIQLEQLLDNCAIVDVEQVARDLHDIEASDKRSLYYKFLPFDDIKSFIDEYMQFLSFGWLLHASSFKTLIDAISGSAKAQLKLEHTMQIVKSYTLISNTTGCPLNYAFTATACQRSESMLKFHLHRENIIMPEIVDPARPNPVNIGGGLIMKPASAYYESYVFVFDFKSLYPSIICEKNLGSWMNLPGLFKKLMQQRKHLASNENPTDLVKCSAIIKQLTNTTIGLFSSIFSSVYWPDFANDITEFGRNILKTAMQSTSLGKVVYAHTDSIFLHIPTGQLGGYEKALEFANDFVSKTNQLYDVISIKLEGIFCNTFICSGTQYLLRYHSEFVEHNSNVSSRWIIKGVFRKIHPPIIEQELTTSLDSVLDKKRFPPFFLSDNIYDYVIALPVSEDRRHWQMPILRFYAQHDQQIAPCLQTVLIYSHDVMFDAEEYGPVTVDEFRSYRRIVPIIIDKSAYFDWFLREDLHRLLGLLSIPVYFNNVNIDSEIINGWGSSFDIEGAAKDEWEELAWEMELISFLSINCSKCKTVSYAIWSQLRKCRYCKQDIEESDLLNTIYRTIRIVLQEYLPSRRTALSIRSPSKIMKYELQLYYLEGLCRANGIIDAADSIIRCLGP